MPTIVYLVHGMGCGTADGSSPPAGQKWSDVTADAVNWISDTFKLSRPAILNPIPAAAPPGSDKPDAVWLVPISYHTCFDEFRASATDRKKAAKAIAPAFLMDAQITELTSTDFAWINCLDLLLWWADTAQTRKRSTAIILNAITAADALARTVPGATIRRVLISHSLGNAATTWALRNLGSNPAWLALGGFDFWTSLANVAPFLMDEPLVYSPPLIPAQNVTLASRMDIAHHEADPIPWLLPWRRWNPADRAANFAADWKVQLAAKRVRIIETQGVAAPPGRKASITDVHGFSNYMMSPGVAERIAGAIRGATFSQAELTTLGWPGAWNQLPVLTCTNTATALKDLKIATDGYIKHPPPDPGDGSTNDWFARTLHAVELLLAAKGAC